jgi:hypothetical protein
VLKRLKETSIKTTERDEYCSVCTDGLHENFTQNMYYMLQYSIDRMPDEL